MIVKTKKYKLEAGTYIKMGLISIIKEQWWVILIALAICLGYFWIASIWWFIGALIAYGLYILFWAIQFTGVTQMEQNKVIFEKLAYEIDSRQIFMCFIYPKLNLFTCLLEFSIPKMSGNSWRRF
jgi:hypothetical protein